jgi:hypothetical protein
MNQEKMGKKGKEYMYLKKILETKKSIFATQNPPFFIEYETT